MLYRLAGSEPAKYVLAGSLAFACDIGVLYVCTELFGVHYLVSNIFGYAAGLGVSWYLNVKWVFTYRRYQRVALEFTIFNIIIVIGLGLSEGLMYLLAGMLGLYYLYAKILASAVVFLFNYTAKKFILFHPWSSKRN